MGTRFGRARPIISGIAQPQSGDVATARPEGRAYGGDSERLRVQRRKLSRIRKRRFVGPTFRSGAGVLCLELMGTGACIAEAARDAQDPPGPVDTGPAALAFADPA